MLPQPQGWGMLPRLTLPPSPATLALIALAFALPGLAGHDLWKTHDAIGLGIVHDMASSGSPLIPRVAGMPWLFDPPLYHWLAAAFGSVFQLVTEFHSGARLVSGVLVLAALWLIYVAALLTLISMIWYLKLSLPLALRR